MPSGRMNKVTIKETITDIYIYNGLIFQTREREGQQCNLKKVINSRVTLPSFAFQRLLLFLSYIHILNLKIQTHTHTHTHTHFSLSFSLSLSLSLSLSVSLSVSLCLFSRRQTAISVSLRHGHGVGAVEGERAASERRTERGEAQRLPPQSPLSWSISQSQSLRGTQVPSPIHVFLYVQHASWLPSSSSFSLVFFLNHLCRFLVLLLSIVLFSLPAAVQISKVSCFSLAFIGTFYSDHSAIFCVYS